jgi:hypothetical protein
LVEKLKENIGAMKENSVALADKGTQAVDKISTGIKLAIEKHNELKQIRERGAPEPVE